MLHFAAKIVVGLIIIIELVQIGEAMNAKQSAAADHPNQKHHADSIGEVEHFYTLIVEPMVKNCEMDLEAPHQSIQTQRADLCANVKRLKALYTDLGRLYNKQKKGNLEEVKIEIYNQLRHF